MSRTSGQLQSFQFVELFNQIGWDGLSVGIEKEVGDEIYTLRPIAQKRNVQILHCLPDSEGAIPPYAIRQKIERKVTADAREHLIIFTDAEKTRQIWQWVSRATSRPAQYREVKWQAGQSTELLEQKLKAISFDLDEEDCLTVFGVAERLRGGFDRDNVTKKFYKVFQAQRDAFQKFIEGIPTDEHQRWYTAVVIDRLMFLWFLQEKFFLDGNKRYLRNRLDDHLLGQQLKDTESVRGELVEPHSPSTSSGRTAYKVSADSIKAPGKASFYKAFLSPLFFRGFAEERTPANRAAIEREFGKVPYLNGGLFAEHELEREYGEAIDIPDTAFSSLFAFFDEWDWHLDERPLASGKEINPDVLGYIFEKFVNQKQMGAYYTKEDITEYIAKNTVIPCLFEKVRADNKAAFDAHAWPLLQEDPRRYVYPAMLHGVDETYPAEIANGLDTQAPNLLERRKPWNKIAAPSRGLPTEIWRETITRHNRTRKILAKLQAGEIRSVADLITYNLNIRQFAQDVIERCTDPALLRAFWVALAGRLPRKSNEKYRHGISVLDPTCGSGAFLFAALQILKPLYQACLTAMSGALFDAALPHPPPSPPSPQPSPKGRGSHHGARGEGALSDIEEIVERFHAAAMDRERDYAITKHIIVHNLYGVDIEMQATEIAKLRLFLKLVALLEPGDDIEPLPDIDFNIRAGNTLVGYASADETERAVKGATQGNLFSDAWEDIRIRLTAVEQAYNNFQIQQVQRGGHVTAEDKQALGDELHELEEMLNYHLCREYGKDPNKGKQYEGWKASHKPFHWYVDFYPIMAAGGFDVVIGNPPWLEFHKVSGEYQPKGLKTVSTNNLWAFVTERSFSLCTSRSGLGLIVPMSLVCTERMYPIQQIVRQAGTSWISNYESDSNPGQLFENVKQNVSILITHNFSKGEIFTTRMARFFSEGREMVFPTISYAQLIKPDVGTGFPKVSDISESAILEKLFMHEPLATHLSSTGSTHILVHRIAHYYIKCFDFTPYFRSDRDGEKKSEDYKVYAFREPSGVYVSAINSSLFYLYWQVFFDAFKAGKHCIEAFPLGALSKTINARLCTIGSKLSTDFLHNSKRLSALYKKTGAVEYDQFFPRQSKALMDEADVVLAQHYGFTDEQLDYIINYDIKYRMGLNGAEEDADD